jgi:hypothetical protein
MGDDRSPSVARRFSQNKAIAEREATMVRELITLPLRVAASTTRFGVHVAFDVLAAGFIVTERLISLALPEPESPAATPSSSWSVEVLAVPAETPPPQAAAAKPAAGPASAEPDAGAEADVLVESFADAGAEDGAGANVEIDEPWDGYAHMTAHEVIHHLTDASAEEAAVVELYEHKHGKRKSVLAAAERRLRQRVAAGSPS